MDVSPKTLREVEFREKMRGYHPEDVDQFLEQVAAGLEVLQDRLRQAVERAQRAEHAASDAGGNDETLRRTLVLAQRTADLAVQEAREQAARVLAGAEQQAQSMLSEADERSRRAYDEAVVEVRAEVLKLEALRQQLQTEVDAIKRWVDEHRTHLLGALEDAAATVERIGTLSTPPAGRPVDLPGDRPPPAAAVLPESPDPSPDGPETVTWHPGEAQEAEPRGEGEGSDPYFTQLRRAVIDTDQPNRDPEARRESAPVSREANSAPDDEALDDFFEDEDGFGDDRRFGGRLRRRR
ncbi:MAG: DivIVA domain-containing protein [Actinomycetota bacterium]|nr:DivIVA domain-containing protein [Actinomycetota bacterium]